jgi:hypothetical protein
MIIPSINLSFDQEGTEPRETQQFSFNFTDSKVAPLMIIGEPNDKYHSIIDIVGKESYHQPNSDVPTNEPLPIDNISLKARKYVQILNLINLQ